MELTKENIAGIHDVVFDASGKDLTSKECEDLVETLPDDIKSLAMEWGCQDSEFREKLYAFITESDE